MDEDTVAMTVRFPRDVHERLRKAAFEQRRTKTEIVVEATREMLAAFEDTAQERGTT